MLIIVSLVAVALADHAPQPSYSAPHKSSYHQESYEEHHPAHYTHNYAVKDDYAGLHYGQDESRDGYA